MSTTTSTETIVPDTSQVERHGYLFGHPIAHSMSPMLHQCVYNNLGLDWTQFPLDSTDMPLFLSLIKHPKFYGMHPQKHSIFTCVSNRRNRRLSNNAPQSRHSQAPRRPYTRRLVSRSRKHNLRPRRRERKAFLHRNQHRCHWHQRRIRVQRRRKQIPQPPRPRDRRRRCSQKRSLRTADLDESKLHLPCKYFL